MVRRGRNEGTIRWLEKKQLWQARYPIGVNEQGKTIHKSIYGKKNEKGKVLAQMRDSLSALGKGEYVDKSGKQLYAWCKEWFEIYKEGNVKINTRAKYKTSLARLKRYDIANMRLKDLNQELIQKFYNKMSRLDELSEETIRATHSLINGALEHAEDVNMIPKNPARKVTIPKDFDEEEVVKALTVEQCDAFLYQLGRRTKYYMYAFLMLNTGLRPGENLALNRADVDLKKKTVKVNKTYLEKEKRVQNSTKTTASRRTVPIPDNTIPLLREYMLKQPKQKPDDPLFQTKTGKRPTPSYLRKRFKFAGEAIGCEWVNLHTMRHTFASRLFAQGKDIKIISKLLGHAKVSTTYDIYVHIINDVIEESIEALNNDIKTPGALPKRSNSKPDNIRELRKLKKASSH
jgi:integrase